MVEMGGEMAEKADVWVEKVEESQRIWEESLLKWERRWLKRRIGGNGSRNSENSRAEMAEMAEERVVIIEQKCQGVGVVQTK